MGRELEELEEVPAGNILGRSAQRPPLTVLQFVSAVMGFLLYIPWILVSCDPNYSSMENVELTLIYKAPFKQPVNPVNRCELRRNRRWRTSQRVGAERCISQRSEMDVSDGDQARIKRANGGRTGFQSWSAGGSTMGEGSSPLDESPLHHRVL